LLIWVGIFAYTRSATIVTIFVLAFWLYYERIIAREELFLLGKFKHAYRDWCRKTPTFFPNPFLWIKPSRDWSMRMVLRREYTTVFAIGVTFFVLDTVAHFLVEGAVYVDASWTALALICVVQYLVLRSLKKLTTVLSILPLQDSLRYDSEQMIEVSKNPQDATW